MAKRYSKHKTIPVMYTCVLWTGLMYYVYLFQFTWVILLFLAKSGRPYVRETRLKESTSSLTVSISCRSSKLLKVCISLNLVSTLSATAERKITKGKISVTLKWMKNTVVLHISYIKLSPSSNASSSPKIFEVTKNPNLYTKMLIEINTHLYRFLGAADTNILILLTNSHPEDVKSTSKIVVSIRLKIIIRLRYNSLDRSCIIWKYKRICSNV